jgi:hypothetical protein
LSTIKFDPMYLVKSSALLNESHKARLLSKLTTLQIVISEIEKLSSISYPTYYVDPVLTLSVSSDNYGGVGVLYARTIPLEAGGRLQIIVQVTGALLLFSTKGSLLRVMAHEFLHYLELVKQFSSGQIYSELAPSSLFEERYEDGKRTINPRMVFPVRRKALIKTLEKDLADGFVDEKLNEKCRELWIEKGLPTAKIPTGLNQTRISIQTLSRASLDPEAVKLVSRPSQKM